jgi:battenin
MEGMCGGSAYVNTFYHVGREGEEGGEGEEGVRHKMEKEFRIGAAGAADSCGEFASYMDGGTTRGDSG